MSRVQVEVRDQQSGPVLMLGGGELSLSWEVESRNSDWKDHTYSCVAEAPSAESREHFLEGLARALGVPVPPERRDSPVTRVVVPYRAGHEETRHLMLGRPGYPIEIAVRATTSTAELASFSCNYTVDAAGALTALAETLRAKLSAAGQTVRSGLRRIGEPSVALLSTPRDFGENDAVLLTTEARELTWGGRVALAHLLSDWPTGLAITRTLRDFVREAQTRGVQQGTPEHEALVWAVACLSKTDPEALQRDPASLERLLPSVLP